MGARYVRAVTSGPRWHSLRKISVRASRTIRFDVDTDLCRVSFSFRTRVPLSRVTSGRARISGVRDDLPRVNGVGARAPIRARAYTRTGARTWAGRRGVRADEMSDPGSAAESPVIIPRYRRDMQSRMIAVDRHHVSVARPSISLSWLTPGSTVRSGHEVAQQKKFDWEKVSHHGGNHDWQSCGIRVNGPRRDEEHERTIHGSTYSSLTVCLRRVHALRNVNTRPHSVAVVYELRSSALPLRAASVRPRAEPWRRAAPFGTKCRRHLVPKSEVSFRILVPLLLTSRYSLVIINSCYITVINTRDIYMNFNCCNNISSNKVFLFESINANITGA